MRYIFLAGALLLGAAIFVSVGKPFSQGERTGVVTKISTKGVFIKTHEGQLLMGGLVSNGSDGMTSNIFRFSVVDDGIRDEIVKVSRSGETVTLIYDQYFIASPLHRKTSYIIREIKYQKPKIEINQVPLD